MYQKIVFVLNLVLLDIFVRTDQQIVKTSSGYIKGQNIQVLNQTIYQYLGIPFAEPPIGVLRFAKPKPISKPIVDIIDATKAKYSCYQNFQSVPLLKDFYGDLSQMSEDCLTLNIWTANNCNNSSNLKSVMFWIYGGGLSLGSIFQHIYNGSVLVTQDVVFVSVNYRLNSFGFLYGEDESAPGNVGLYDQLLALKWVRQNIHLFCGDKNQITIFGESAGSWSVSAHLLSPLSTGLFKRAIMQSGALLYNKYRYVVTKEEALLSAKITAKRLNCTDDKQWIQCLRKVDAKQLIPHSFQSSYPIEGEEFLPFSAQKAFNDKKFNKGLDIMAGVTKDEGPILAITMMPEIITKNLTKMDFVKYANIVNNIFHNIDVGKVTEFYLNNTNLNDSDAIKWKILDFAGDLAIKCPTYHFAKRYAEQSTNETNVYFYQLTHKARDLIKGLHLGVYHTADIEFVFGLPLFNPSTSSVENIRFSKEVMKLWTDFAKYGSPDINWPKLIDNKSHSSVTTIKDLNPKNSKKYLINYLLDKTCDGFWKAYYLDISG